MNSWVLIAVVLLSTALVGCSSKPKCTVETCAGCCGVSDQCELAPSAQTCGTGAVACRNCAASGQQCLQGACVGGSGGGGGGGAAGGSGGGAGGGDADAGTGGGGGAGCACAPKEVCRTTGCLWNDPTLTALSVSPGTLAFLPATTTYAVTVPSGTSQVVVTPTVAMPARATLKVNGTITASGAGQNVSLSAAMTTVTIEVTAESLLRRTYTVVVTVVGYSQQAYVKASNTAAMNMFGQSIALSPDGTTLAVGSSLESTSGVGSGAVYVFVLTGAGWAQQAFLKASNVGDDDRFGVKIALSADGSTLAVGADQEDSNATGLDGGQADDSMFSAGAVYVFTRTGTAWAQQSYVKASNTNRTDYFGSSVALSGDGNTLAVGAAGEGSNSTGIDGDQTNNNRMGEGAVYVFTRAGTVWTQQAYVKASYAGSLSKDFGRSVALSSAGDTMAVGAPQEASNAVGINGNQTDSSALRAGAAYVFTRAGTVWSQQAYVKASNAEREDIFGETVALSGDGNTLAVGAPFEASIAVGAGGIQTNNSARASGAVYVFTRAAAQWTQQAYVKACNTDQDDHFGSSLAISADGNTLAVGATGEDSDAKGVNGDPFINSLGDSGAVYTFTRASSGWFQQDYVKASNTGAWNAFGASVSLSATGRILSVGAMREDSNATGVGGNQLNNSAANSGAAYVFTR